MNEHVCFLKPEVQRLMNRYLNEGILLTYEQYEVMYLNSYERIALYPIMDNECLLKVCTKMQDNITAPRAPTTYEDTILHIMFPLLIERLKREATGNHELMKMYKQADLQASRLGVELTKIKAGL